MRIARAEEIGLGVPPPLVPKRPETARVALLGRRLVLNHPEGWVRDHVAASNIYEAEGRTYIDVLLAREFELPEDERPEPRRWPVHLVWLED